MGRPSCHSSDARRSPPRHIPSVVQNPTAIRTSRGICLWRGERHDAALALLDPHKYSAFSPRVLVPRRCTLRPPKPRRESRRSANAYGATATNAELRRCDCGCTGPPCSYAIAWHTVVHRSRLFQRVPSMPPPQFRGLSRAAWTAIACGAAALRFVASLRATCAHLPMRHTRLATSSPLRQTLPLPAPPNTANRCSRVASDRSHRRRGIGPARCPMEEARQGTHPPSGVRGWGRRADPHPWWWVSPSVGLRCVDAIPPTRVRCTRLFVPVLSTQQRVVGWGGKQRASSAI
jgi:hypothetical protein